MRFARNASFDTGFGYAESDVVMRLGSLLYLGARPLDGSGLTTEAKRPLSFAPGLRRKTLGPEPRTALPTLKDISGEWQSACEKQVPIDTATGHSASGKFWTREFRITAEGRWSGKFTTFSDPACHACPTAFTVEKCETVITGYR